MLAVKVHSGSAHVRGAARNYPYYVASLFEAVTHDSGKQTWRNTGVHVGPFRSARKAAALGEALAAERGAEFVAGYGSLHNRPVVATKAYQPEWQQRAITV